MNVSVHPSRHGEAAPGLLLQLLEVRALWEHYAALALRSAWGAAPRGDGHPVLVLPGLAAGDASTALMRRFLRSRGYAAAGWRQGLNLGFREGVMDRAHDKLRELYAANGRKVSLIGWSLGGLYARELAKLSPELVRLVITLGSPFTGHPRDTNAWRLYEFASGHRIDSHDFHGPMRAAPPGPDDVDLEPDRRRRRMAMQRRDAARDGREHCRRVQPPGLGRASGGPLRDRRPARPAGRALGAVPSRRLAAPRLCDPHGKRVRRECTAPHAVAHAAPPSLERT